MFRHQQSGFSIVSVLVATGLGVMLMYFVSEQVSHTMKASKHLSLKTDIESLRMHILSSIDCDKTLAQGRTNGSTSWTTPINLTSGNDCDPSSANYKLLELRDKNNNRLTDTLTNTAGNFQNTGRAGEWGILTQCDRRSTAGSFQNTLVIRAARGTSGFTADPLTKKTYNWNTTPLYLFGGGNAPKLCQAQLGGSSGCTAGMLCNGVAQYVPLWTAPNALGLSSIFQEAGTGDIGIGTTTPGKRLHVLNNTENLLRLENSATPSRWDVNIRNGNFIIGDDVASQDRFMLASNGRVGLRTTAPESDFHVALSGEATCPNRSTALFRNTNPNSAANISLEGNVENTTAMGNVGSVNFVNTNAANGSWWHMSMRGATESNNLEFHHRPAGGTNPWTGNDSFANCQAANNATYYWKMRASDGALETPRLAVVGRSAASGYPAFLGSITATGPATAQSFTPSSDRRLKKDINSLPSGILEKVNALTGVSFLWKIGEDNNRHLGVIAQEVEPIFPDLVSSDEDGMKRVSYDGFTAIFIEAFKELYALVKDLASRLDETAALREEVAELRAELRALKEELKKSP